jgi:hypothetical protein
LFQLGVLRLVHQLPCAGQVQERQIFRWDGVFGAEPEIVDRVGHQIIRPAGKSA